MTTVFCLSYCLFLFCLLDGSRAVRAVSVSGTKRGTAATAEILLGRGGFIAGAADRSLVDDGATVVNSTLIVEVAAVGETDDDVGDTVEHPDKTEADTPVADKTEDEKTGDEIDDTAAKRRDHTSDGSEDGGGLELDSDEENGDNEKVGREHTDGEVGGMTVELHTPLHGVLNTMSVRAGVGGNERENTINKKKNGKNNSDY